MPKEIINYSSTIIYKLVCKDLNIIDIYVGHTTNFIKRKAQHKYCCNNPNNKAYNFKVYQIIRDNGNWDNWEMIEIEKYNCNDSNEATARERHWFEILQAKLNIQCPNQTRQEYCDNNKEKILVRQKNYRDNNKEKISVQQKECYEKYKDNRIHQAKKYYEDNKEEILSRQKHYYINNTEKLSVKQKESYEKNKDTRIQQVKKYYEDNKEKVSLYRKNYCENNKDIIKEKQGKLCSCGICGAIYTHSNKSRHNKSEFHINKLEQK